MEKIKAFWCHIIKFNWRNPWFKLFNLRETLYSFRNSIYTQTLYKSDLLCDKHCEMNFLRLLDGWINENAIKDIAFTTLMIIAKLLLQKLSKSSNAKDHLKAIERKLELWKQNDLNELLHETMTIEKKNLIANTKRYLQSDWLRGV